MWPIFRPSLTSFFPYRCIPILESFDNFSTSKTSDPIKLVIRMLECLLPSPSGHPAIARICCSN